MDLSPHICCNGGTTVTVNNLSEGSLAMSTVIKNYDLLQKWVETNPRVTVIHAFACDVVKKKSIELPHGISFGTFFTDYMLESLEALRHFAQENMPDTVL